MRHVITAVLLLATSSAAFAITGATKPMTAAQLACKDAPPFLRDVCIWGYETFGG